jgi:GNAT superfamily N-acetyltransferase
MANAEIEVVGPGHLDIITEMYNTVFRPSKNAEFFKRRLKGRLEPLLIMASLEGRPVGFATGFELKPSTYFMWLCGVIPDARRMGVAAQLTEASHVWAASKGYAVARFECYSRHRPMLHMAIKAGYDIVGIRWDADGHDNLIIFEKSLTVEYHED